MAATKIKGYRVTASMSGEIMFAAYDDGRLYSTAIRENAEDFNPEGTEWHVAQRLPLGAKYLGKFNAPVE